MTTPPPATPLTVVGPAGVEAVGGVGGEDDVEDAPADVAAAGGSEEAQPLPPPALVEA